MSEDNTTQDFTEIWNWLIGRTAKKIYLSLLTLFFPLFLAIWAYMYAFKYEFISESSVYGSDEALVNFWQIFTWCGLVCIWFKRKSKLHRIRVYLMNISGGLFIWIFINPASIYSYLLPILGSFAWLRAQKD